MTNPKTDQSVLVGRWSYLWAGLLGAVFVAWKGMSARFLYAALINIGFAVMVLGVSAVTSFVLPAKQQFIVMVVGVPVVIALQGSIMVKIVRDGYRKRGWRIRANE